MGVDYDGSGTNFESSMNYTINEYASDVVYRIKSVCDARAVPHPMIVSESGRAIAAHHSLLVFDTLGSSKLDQFKVTGRPEEDYHGKGRSCRNRCAICSTAIDRSMSAGWWSATTTELQAREQALQMFNLGYLSLEFRWPLAEKLYWATCYRKIRDYCRKLDRVPEEPGKSRGHAQRHLFLQLFRCFNRLPDSWAIGQLFPIMHHSAAGGAAPRAIAVLADITCDSGRQNRSLRASPGNQTHSPGCTS